MDISVFLAKVMGVYLLVVSLSLFLNRKIMVSIIKEIFSSSALQFIMGINILIIGVLLIVSHNIWVASWPVVVTIIAWMVFIKGLLYTALPEKAQAIARPFLESSHALSFSIFINFLLGLFLCYYGFIAIIN